MVDYDKAYKEVYPYLVRYLTFKCKNPYLAEDLASDTMYKVYRSFKSGNLIAYATTAANNVLKDYWKKKKLATVSMSEFVDQETGAEYFQVADDYLNPIEQIINQELKEVLQEAFDSLGESNRETAKLYYQEQRGMPEVMKMLDIKDSTFRTRLFKARKDMQARLENVKDIRVRDEQLSYLFV